MIDLCEQVPVRSQLPTDGSIIKQRERIKRQTIEHWRLQDRKLAA